MRIVLDFNSILKQRQSGFFTYGAGLLAGLAELPDRPEVALLCDRRQLADIAWLGDLPGRLGAQWISPRIKMRWLSRWWGRMSWPSLQHWAGDFDVYHCTHCLMPPTRRRPRVLTVHDLRRYRYPEFYPNSKLGAFENAVRRADHFIAISQATKLDLQEIFGIPGDRIDVVYHGGPAKLPLAISQAPPAGDGAELARLGLAAGRYFLLFSSSDQRKNIGRMRAAFGRAGPRLGPDYRLAIVGRGVKGEPAEPADGARVVRVGLVEDLSPLLCGATALVYASLYEGFGLPILEAMAAGTPVITSKCSAMPEVAGEAALLVDPLQIDAIAEAMVQVAQDESLRQRLIAAGRSRTTDFSWAKTAGETLAVYRRLA